MQRVQGVQKVLKVRSVHVRVRVPVLVLVLSALPFIAACGVQAGGPPEISVDRTACAHCGMLISEAVFAAAYQGPSAEARVFDDIGCLLEAVRREGPSDGLRFWFQDAAGGGWMEGGAAVFVRSAQVRTPMGGGLLAFRDPAAAGRAAAEHQGRVVRSLGELVASGRTGGGS